LGYKVTVYDNLSNGKLEFINRHFGEKNFSFIEADIMNFEILKKSMKGHDLVWHLASNTDIINSQKFPRRDLEDCVIGTFNVLESMRENSINSIIFSSSGAVYGNLCKEKSVTEDAGPMLPISTYAAGKVSCEVFISAYCELYDIRAWIYRFGNVIGARMTHGVIFDFIRQLQKDQSKLLIKGDGSQEKNYFLVEECIEGMVWGFNHSNLSKEEPCKIVNLGTNSTTRVQNIAAIIIQEMRLKDTKIEIEGTKKAWPGDQPKVYLSVSLMNSYGWTAKNSSDDAVKIAVKRMVKE
jgi:UDP-glucose 4-epimerase